MKKYPREDLILRNYLEAWINLYGLARIIDVIAEICLDKSAMGKATKAWEKDGLLLEKVVAKLVNT